MPRKPSRIPKYCLHTFKRKGGAIRKLAYCRVDGKTVYLGTFDSPESRQAYARLLAELAASPVRNIDSQQTPEGLTIVELCAAYLDFCEGYYVKHGQPTRHVDAVKLSIRAIRELYGFTPAAEFGPKALKALRQSLVEKKHSRRYVNEQIGNLKRMFKWGTSEEVLPPSVYHALQTVTGLRKGRTEARETAPIGPVAEDVVNATLNFLPATVADMVRFQRLTGCRPGEVCQLRPMDLDRSGEIWEYRPSTHKTEHHDKKRLIFVGPKAQAVLRPYLDRSADVLCFRPIDSEAKRFVELRARRKTRVQPSQRNRKKAKPKRRPSERYGKDAYRNAILRGVKKANRTILKEAADMGIATPSLLPHWHPNQLRHSAATTIRKTFGLEAAQVILGHSRADVTQVYAERDNAKALEVIRKIG
jgi:integrase